MIDTKQEYIELKGVEGLPIFIGGNNISDYVIRVQLFGEDAQTVLINHQNMAYYFLVKDTPDEIFLKIDAYNELANGH